MQEAKEKANEILRKARKTAALQSEEMLKAAQDTGSCPEREGRERDCPGEKAKAVNELKMRLAAWQWILPAR